MRHALSLVAALLLAVAATHPASGQTPSTLMNADVVRFVATGMPDQVVMTLIDEANNARATQFDLSPSAVSDLAGHGVSQVVIAAMRQSSAFSASGASPLSLSATAQQGPQLKTTLDLTPPGIQPLTAESLQRALAEGERNGPHLNDSLGWLLDKMASRGDVTSTDDLPRAALLMSTSPPFTFVLWSPYTEATSRAATAKRQFQPRPTLSMDDLNRQQVVVTVVPSSNFLKAAAIENVVIKRGTDVLRAIKADVKPVEIGNLAGAKRTVSEGHFTFPFSAFDASGPITIVLIGNSGNFEWIVTREELARMK